MPRKAQPEFVDGPPGPISLEIRVNDKIALRQNVHSYEIDQQDHQFTVSGVLKLPVEKTKPEPATVNPGVDDDSE